MEELEAELKKRLERAAKLVEHLPEDLRPVAFSKAFEGLADGKTRKRRGGRKSAASGKSGGVGTSGSNAAKGQASGAKGRRSGARTGGMTAIRELIADGFFKSRRTLPQIQDHLRTKRVLQFKQSDLSSPLAQLTRKGELEREENDEGAFEYWVVDK